MANDTRLWRSRLVTLASLVLGMLFVLHLNAADNGRAPAFDLDETIKVAVRENPTLTSMREKLRAMQERPAQARSFSNPMFTYSGMDMANGGSFPDTNEKRFMVQQEFPWFGKRGLREGIAQTDAETMQLELEAMILDVVMMVKESYYDLHAVQSAIVITRDETDVVQRMAKIADAMYSTGDRTQQDLLKAQAEQTLLKQKLLELKIQESTLKTRLNSLLNRRADAPLGFAVTPPQTDFHENIEQLFALATTHRPEILAARTQIERYQREKQLMSKESFPDYKLGMEYRNFGVGDDMVMFSVSVDLPLWRSKYNAGVREAGKMRASSEATRDAAERQTSLDVQDAYFKFVTTRQMLDIYKKELIPQAESRFKSSEADYQTGKVDFMDFLESERFLLNTRLMAVMTEGSLGMLFARVERAVGQSLQTGAPAGKSAATQGAEHGK